MSIFTDRLKELRGSESQASFAEQLGINRVQYFKYESGKNAPSIEVLANICRVHACSSDWLLGLSDSRGGPSADAACGSAGGVCGAVAIGTGAKATMKTGTSAAACVKCPYKKKLQALEKVLSR